MGDGCETVSTPVHGRQRAPIDWAGQDWSKTKRAVGKIQGKIYQKTREGNFRGVKRLQKLLFKSLETRCLAVHRVTEVNSGRFTPGVDDRLCNTDAEKVTLVEELRSKNYKPEPCRLCLIPKKDGDSRKLGIPTILDRAMQALVLLAMEPEWEARFEPHSYGFRPGRGPIDVINDIGTYFLPKSGRKNHPGWVLDADISKCFDNINHDALLKKIGDSPFLFLIKAWLKAGTISKVGFKTSNRGSPQGGVISPLLANIALDGLERLFSIYTRNGTYKSPSIRSGMDKFVLVYRYADDFLIFALSRDIIIEYVIPKVKKFLAGIGLELNEAKTRVTNISDGFNFLGFHFMRFHRKDGSVSKFIYHPQRERIDRFLRELKLQLHGSYSIPVQDMIRTLNRRIRGFCNYFRWSNAHEMFSYLDHRLFESLYSWARHKHYKRGKKWLRKRYWCTTRRLLWQFSFEGVDLLTASHLKVQWWKWPKLRIHSSPHDRAAFDYWYKKRRDRIQRAGRSGGAEN